MVPVSTAERNAWQVVIRPTAEDHLNVPKGGVWHDGNGGYAAAQSLLQEWLDPPNNAYQGAIMGVTVVFARE
jgi:hypothetical protein